MYVVFLSAFPLMMHVRVSLCITFVMLFVSYVIRCLVLYLVRCVSISLCFAMYVFVCRSLFSYFYSSLVR